ASGESDTVDLRTTLTPAAPSARAISEALVSTVSPSSSSVPMVSSSTSMLSCSHPSLGTTDGRRPGWSRRGAKQRPVPVHVDNQGVARQHHGNGERDRDQGPVEPLPEVRQPAPLQTEL